MNRSPWGPVAVAFVSAAGLSLLAEVLHWLGPNSSFRAAEVARIVAYLGLSGFFVFKSREVFQNPVLSSGHRIAHRAVQLLLVAAVVLFGASAWADASSNGPLVEHALIFMSRFAACSAGVIFAQVRLNASVPEDTSAVGDSQPSA